MSKIVAKQGRAYNALHGRSFLELAAASGLSAPTVSRVFHGEPVSLRTARKICDLLGCRFADLFEIKKGECKHE